MKLTESATHFVRPMRPDDVPQAIEIDHECFPTLWPPTPFKRDLSNSLARYFVAVEKHELGDLSQEPTPLLLPSAQDCSPVSSFGKRLFASIHRFLPKGDGLAEPPALNHGDRIVGVVGLWFMVDEAHITTIGVREACRRCGIGELLLIAAADAAMEHDARFVTLEVRVSNEAAQALYEKCGFRRVGVRKNYYTDNREDAVIMTTDRLTLPSFREHLDRLKQAYLERWGSARVLSPPPPHSAGADNG
ncbi:MAG: ribosomal protein S18-alanine N-acetyltransferase [Chloroflexi bacterium]|nr:ribosomal protein S18-alanine N-acetyltransferase [Chloroflexota bacterium]